VAGYTIEANRSSVIADPIAAIAPDGLRLMLTSVAADQTVQVELRVSRLQRPLGLASVPLTTGFSELQMQVPVYANHRLQATVPAPPNKTVALSYAVGPGSDALLILIQGF